jgi:hypothetical protein
MEYKPAVSFKKRLNFQKSSKWQIAQNQNMREKYLIWGKTKTGFDCFFK